MCFQNRSFPGYPRGFNFGAIVGRRTDEGRALYSEYYNNSISLESEDLKQLEGRCFVLGCNQYYTKSMYPKKYQHLVKNESENMCPGGSVIVSPLGKIIAGPLFNEAGAVLAEIDLEDINHAKLDFDVIGHYSRNLSST